MGGLGPIPFTSIIKWCKLNGINDVDDIDLAYRHFKAMEGAEYQFDNKKDKAKK
jgi:hypothetical protein